MKLREKKWITNYHFFSCAFVFFHMMDIKTIAIMFIIIITYATRYGMETRKWTWRNEKTYASRKLLLRVWYEEDKLTIGQEICIVYFLSRKLMEKALSMYILSECKKKIFHLNAGINEAKGEKRITNYHLFPSASVFFHMMDRKAMTMLIIIITCATRCRIEVHTKWNWRNEKTYYVRKLLLRFWYEDDNLTIGQKILCIVFFIEKTDGKNFRALMHFHKKFIPIKAARV